MNFDRTEEQELIAASIARFVERDYTFGVRRRILASAQGYSDDVWQTMAKLGLLGVTLPSEHGGLGGGAGEAMSLMEGIGDALILEPWLPTVGLGAQFVARGGSDAQRAQILPAVIEGRRKLAFAYAEAESRHALHRIATRARRDAHGYIVSGVKRIVAHAVAADMLIVSVRTQGEEADREGVSLLLIPRDAPGITLQPLRMLDGTRAAEVTLRDVHIPVDALLGREDHALPLIEEVVDFATALVCAEAVGAIRSANAATLEYLKTREQFGVPIGSFQAVQHMLADIPGMIDGARLLTHKAAWAEGRDWISVDDNEYEHQLALASMAFVFASDVAAHATDRSLHLLGGYGFSREYPVERVYRDIRGLCIGAGTVEVQRNFIGTNLLRGAVPSGHAWIPPAR